MTTNTPDHVARAHAIQSDLAPLAEVLEQHGATVTLELVPDRTFTAVVMIATFTGTLAKARKLASLIECAGRARGHYLTVAALDRFRDGLRPDEQRVGVVGLCPA